MVYKDVIGLEAVVKHFTTLATSHLKEVGDRERDILSSKISDIERRWKDVRVKVITREECIRQLFPICQQFSEAFEELLSWLKTANNELNEVLPIACEQEQLIQQKRVVEVCRFEILTFIFTLITSSL